MLEGRGAHTTANVQGRSRVQHNRSGRDAHRQVARPCHGHSRAWGVRNDGKPARLLAVMFFLISGLSFPSNGSRPAGRMGAGAML